MHALPHLYTVEASARGNEGLQISSGGLPDFTCDAPREFDGPGHRWSPETLLCASLAGCFVLTFRAIARASKVDWRRLGCRVEGKLERIDNVMQFTVFTTEATLEVPEAADSALCTRLLEKAEHTCLIANSLRSRRELRTTIIEV